MSSYDSLAAALSKDPRRWLVTGAAGFIGSNLVERLLELGQEVVGLDNFATGHQRNLDDVAARTAGLAGAGGFHFIEGDICDAAACREATKGADYVLHQAALGSVPRSIENPIATNRANIDGFVEMLVAARDAKVKRFVYAASSSTYGDHPGLPKVEDQIGRPLSPYAVTKYVNELYASVFQRTYGIQTVGLRYFNVFGRRQDPNGAYAAVIPAWIAALMDRRPCYINGDGETTRDFCYIENVVQANLLSATADAAASDQVYNVAVGERTTLNELFVLLRDGLAERGAADASAKPVYREFRAGDVRHSLADVSKARKLLGYEPEWQVKDGLAESLDWYVADARGATAG